MDNDPDLTVLNLGAGVQSSCLYLMACKGDATPRPDVAIFADTGWEPREVYDHLARLQDAGDIPINIVSRGNLRKDVLDHIRGWRKKHGGYTRVGQPPFYVQVPKEKLKNSDTLDAGGTLWRQCTKEYKIDPIVREIRRLLGYAKGQKVKKRVHQWFGISRDEMQRMRINDKKWIDNIYPLIDMRMDRNNCISWLLRNGWDSVPKSACIGCPYHNDKYWRNMKDNHSAEWDDAVEFDKELRTGPFPHLRGEVYLHRSFVPLDQVDLLTREDRGQLSFLDECDGMCGV